jgi:hypothetical protein
MSKQRLRSKLAAADAEIVRLKIEIAALGPVIAAAEEMRDLDDENERYLACLIVATDAICAAVDARRAGAPAPADDHADRLLAGFVPDAPAQRPEDVAAFLAYEWPGDEGEICAA